MLLTKLHKPTSSSRLIHRTPLTEKLNNALNNKLTLISAPAGYGKTCLIYNQNINRNSDIPIGFIKKVIQVINNSKKKIVNSDEILSLREFDVLNLIREGFTNQEIADTLFISSNTVKTHLKNINIKLEVNSRVEAVTKAKEVGIF